MASGSKDPVLPDFLVFSSGVKPDGENFWLLLEPVLGVWRLGLGEASFLPDLVLLPMKVQRVS